MTGWAITWGDHSWTDDDLLAGDLATVQLLTEGTWVQCEPRRGPVELMAMISALVARATGRNPLAVLEELRLLPAGRLLDAIQQRRDDGLSGDREVLRPAPTGAPARAVA